ncbi:MAG: small subunit ribosomal protein S20 [Oceanicoccus sp.]
MANSAGSRKRARQAVNRRSHNASLRSMVRTYLKKVRAAIDTKSYDDAQAALTAAAPFVDKMVTKGIMHKNKAARVKSRLNAAVVALKG